MTNDLTTLKSNLTTAYNNLIFASQNAFLAEQEATAAKSDLTIRVAVAENEGSITGRNAVTREAMAREMFAADYLKVERLTAAAALAAHERHICQLRVDLARAHLRITELAAPTMARNGLD